MNKEAVLRRVTDGVAVGGVTLPAWWPSLAQVSDIAAQLVPIMSAAWLAVQLFDYMRKRKARG